MSNTCYIWCNSYSIPTRTRWHTGATEVLVAYKGGYEHKEKETALPLSFSHLSHLCTIPNICSSLLCFYLQSRYEGIQNLKDQIMKLNPDIMCIAYLLDLKFYYRLLINSCIWMNVFWDWETICFSQLPSGSWSKTWNLKLRSIQIN